MLKSKISKEEVNTLPIAEFKGEIVVVDEPAKVKPALDYLKQQKVVGLDTETKPSFQRGTIHKVSLVQISSLEKCYLFRLNKIGFPNELLQFLMDVNVKKVGLSLRDDFNGLSKRSIIRVLPKITAYSSWDFKKCTPSFLVRKYQNLNV